MEFDPTFTGKNTEKVQIADFFHVVVSPNTTKHLLKGKLHHKIGEHADFGSRARGQCC